ncbi:D-alanyl-D-alanine carboxypeptidase [Gordonia bronchialis]|uniref:M15 family metallopeptidase n=1 Tax=Gordonia bronchialis TaxID=2054 RepID=UPI00019B920D|nr:M15 family metallopeptidase [Gordonia bronchialis]MCC3324541.1 M15 family metallopeptidase [Gordonia bronchialis]QGS24639.1 peptidase M15 [Gordonia bronchialis]UAK39112.1 M15 family metallopeptidase [Gordonia bronchialis]STQ64643.1 D-alanyl-D-alanine carboxypeptidase [Gordonia bronchialis]
MSTRPSGPAWVTVLAALAVTAAVVTPFSAPKAQAAPATSGLDPVLATAYRQAAATAHAQGVALDITSGRRSVAEQRRLWRSAIATYGSPQAARRWVLPPEQSTHVTGHAVDVGPRAGARWLQTHGYRWGLCRTFVNEWWHFEVVTIRGLPCPPMWPDAAARADRRPA